MLKFAANPTFKTTVTVPTTDGPQTLKVTFKYMPTDAWDAFVAERVARKAQMTDVMAELIESWEDAEKPCSVESLKELDNVHAAAIDTLFAAYTDARKSGKLEN